MCKYFKLNYKKFMMTKILLLFLVIVLFVGNFVNADSETAYNIGDYVINATVLKNGNVHVSECIKFDFHDVANGIYRDILYRYTYSSQNSDMKPSSSRYQADSIENILVTETSSSYEDENKFSQISESNARNGMKNYFSISNIKNDGYIKRIKIYSPSQSSSTKYLKIEYDLKDVAVLYNDFGEIYWNFVGKDWDCDISNLKININFEQEYNMENIRVYPHGYTDIINLVNEDGKISFEVEKLKRKTAVDARVVFPASYLDSSVKKQLNENYDFNTLNKIEKNMEFGKTRNKISNFMNYVIIAITIMYIIILFIKSDKVSSKGKNKKVEYYTQPLENLSLSVYLKLCGGSVLSPNLLMATILDLHNKKVINMDSQKKVKKSFDGIEYDYYLTINEGVRLDSLNEYERIVINYLFNSNPTPNITTFKEEKIELNKRFKELSKNTYSISKLNAVCTKHDKKIESTVYEKTDSKLKRFSFIFMFCIIVISLINVFLISPLNIDLKIDNISIYIVAGMFVFMFAIMLTFVKSLKPDYYEEYNNLKGLQKYLKDYSLIKDRYPIEIALWDRYLVFACLFGIAKKVAKEFKEELIRNGYDDDYIYINYPMINMAMYSSTISTYAASSTGSSSSGGFSGGGSGGGGRWRWPVVVLSKNNVI